MIKDPYAVLGLEPDASADDIKKAYRLMAKKYHPDLHPDDPEIQEKMNAVNEAYDMLTNPNKYAAKQAQESAQKESADVEIVSERTPAANQAIPRPVVMADDSEDIRQVVELLNANRFQDAIAVLTLVPSTGRNARWYYLSALANHMMCNYAPAAELMHKAVQMDPSNDLYMQLFMQFQQAIQSSAKKAPGFPISPLIPIALLLGYFLGKFIFGQG